MASILSAVMAMVLDIDRVETYTIGDRGYIVFSTTTFTDPIGNRLVPVKMFLFNLIDTPMKLSRMTRKDKIYNGIVFDQYYVECEVPAEKLKKVRERVGKAREALKLHGPMRGERLLDKIRRY